MPTPNSHIDEIPRCEEHAALEEELHGLRGLLSVAQVVVSSLELDEVLQNILFSAMGFMDMPAGSIALYDEQTERLKLHAHAGLSAAFVAKDRWRVKPGGLTHRILDDGELFVIEDTRHAPCFNNPLALDEGIRSLIAVPLKVQRKMVGILYLNDFKPRRFPEPGLKILPIHASFAAMSIDNARLYQQTQVLACTDGLTGLYNHRQFKKILREEMSRTARYRKPMALILFDVDDFKLFNDRYGHPVGDKVLQTVATILREILRECDLAFRYGGEEFAVILPETTIEEALVAAERIRDAIYSRATRYLEGVADQAISVSAGVAAYPRDASNPEGLLLVVDGLLYRAKGGGKNTIHYQDGSA